MEDKFYREGLQNYTQADFVAAGFADPFYDNLKEISFDETTHVDFLTKALGAAAVAECIYSFPSTDAASFVGLASVLEGVGVSAYLGAAASIMDKTTLTQAGSILTVEARHSSYLRAVQSESPYPSPFDTPLDINEVYTLASQFIVSCPSTNAALPATAFPALTLATTGTITAGTTITLLTPGYSLEAENGSDPLTAAFITILGATFANATKIDGGFTVVVPPGVDGQSYVVLTNACEATVTDDSIAAGPAIVEISK